MVTMYSPQLIQYFKLKLFPQDPNELVLEIFEIYHKRFRVNRLLVLIGAGVLIGELKLRNTYM